MRDESDYITERLTRDLREGVFTPGSWLKQIDLQTRYGVGRTSVRKALEVLAGRRLIRHERNRGYSVHPADRREITELLAIRVAVETGFAEAICAAISPAQLKRIEEVARSFDQHTREGRFDQLDRLDRSFHHKLLMSTGNRTMVQMIDDLCLRTTRKPFGYWDDFRRIEHAARDHLEMVEAISAGQSATLALLMRGHILR